MREREYIFIRCPEETLGKVLLPENVMRRMLACQEDLDKLHDQICPEQAAGAAIWTPA